MGAVGNFLCSPTPFFARTAPLPFQWFRNKSEFC